VDANRAAGGARMINTLPFMTYTLVMSITPGPNNIMLTASGASFGFKRTLPQMAGICTGFAVQLIAVSAGLAAVFARWPLIRSLLAAAGAAYLVFLGWQMLRSNASDAHQTPRPVSFLEAAMFQFLNPKAWVMGITVATLFLPQGFGFVGRNAYMVGISEGIGLPCMAVWALFGSALKSHLAVPRNLRLFNIVMAVALAGTALAMVLL
jgi:threonine/homoserine/homoserine lactone efflux protein